jgi:hypothetical protein
MIVSMDFLALFLDEIEKIGSTQAVVRSFNEQLFDEWLEGLELLRAQRGPAVCHKAALPRVTFEDTLIGESANGLLDGVRVHAELAANDANRWHLLPWLKLANRNRLLYRSNDLFVDRLAQLEMN